MAIPVKALSPAKKGDVVVYEVRNSATSADFKTKRWTTWAIGTVVQASREGLVKKIRPAKAAHTIEPSGQVLTIGAHQDKGLRLIESLSYGHEFANTDELKAAIIAA